MRHFAMRNDRSLARNYICQCSRGVSSSRCRVRRLCAPGFPGPAQTESAADFKLDIATTTLELSSRTSIRTSTYNGIAPAPLLRFKEGQPVTVEVTNRTDPEVVHWHGLYLPTAVDGAIEEGLAGHPAGCHGPLHVDAITERLSLVLHAHDGHGRPHSWSVHRVARSAAPPSWFLWVLPTVGGVCFANNRLR